MINGKVSPKLVDNRTIKEIVYDGNVTVAKLWYISECEKLGCSGNEQLSLITPEMYNIHTSFDGEFFKRIIMVAPNPSAPVDSFAVKIIFNAFPDVPVCGAGASPDSSGVRKVYPAGKDVSVLLIRDDRYKWQHDWLNLHRVINGKVSPKLVDNRTIKEIVYDGNVTAAKQWYIGECEKLGCSGNEQLSLITSEMYNIHTSFDGEFLHTGTNVFENSLLGLGFLKQDLAGEEIQKACNKKNTLYFGCAGLYGLSGKTPELDSSSLVGFFHGEVLTTKGGPRFANLMISRLTAVTPEEY